jgi:ABC-type sugar transport system ATPase subunit
LPDPASAFAAIASGVLRPDSGRIFIADREVRLTSPRAAREEGVVIVHQSTDQLGVPGLSVAENLLLDVLCDWITAYPKRRALDGGVYSTPLWK